MKLVCPNCESVFPEGNVNVSTNLAKCDVCNFVYKVDELVEYKTDDEILKPPAGSRIIIKKGLNGSLELLLPKTGFKPSMIFLSFFMLFWISFVAFWTVMAASASVFFALFSIPFWLVGIAMIIGLINSIYESQKITLSRSKFILIKNRPIKSSRLEIHIQEIQDIRMKPVQSGNLFSLVDNSRSFTRQRSQRSKPIETPAIISDSNTTYFFGNATTEEQEWVTLLLEHTVKRLKG